MAEAPETHEYVVLLLGEVDRWWNDMTEEEKAAGYQAHGRFSEELVRRGHQIVGGAELHGSAHATRVTPDLAVTEGPYAELTEQVGGFYQVRTADLADLVEVCKILAETGDTVDIRRIVTEDERAAGGAA